METLKTIVDSVTKSEKACLFAKNLKLHPESLGLRRKPAEVQQRLKRPSFAEFHGVTKSEHDFDESYTRAFRWLLARAPTANGRVRAKGSTTKVQGSCGKPGEGQDHCGLRTHQSP
jgi:hypothetical protein